MRDFRTLLQEEHRISGFGESLRKFRGIPIGPVWVLSIQASCTHYCTPRQTLPADEYEEWEVGAINQGRLVHLPDGCPGEDMWEPGDSSVGAYVPTAVVQSVYEWFVKNHGFPMEQLAAGLDGWEDSNG